MIYSSSLLTPQIVFPCGVMHKGF